jgi:2-deoxy-D-gluconate 3-dehydrogenase
VNAFDLTGRLAVVTGARRGIGRAMARALAEAGADVIGVSAQLEETGSDVEKDVLAAGRTFEALRTDFADPEAVRALGTDLAGRERPVDILVNNAGTIRRAPATEHTDEDWELVLQVNLNAQFALSRAVGAAMVARGHGKIVFTASLLSFQGGITVPGYTTAKHGIAGLTKALANEWAPHGVNVNAIAPGYIATDNTHRPPGRPGPQQGHPGPHPGRPLGQRRRPGGRHGVPRLGRRRLRPRRRPARRRRMARPMTGTDPAAVLDGARVLPVLTVPSAAMAGPLADALVAGGARCAEVTFRTPDAEQVLKTMAAHGGLTVGAGTVLTPEQVDRAVAAGARFVVSPGFDEDVVAKCRELGVTVVPGIASATELMRALRSGLDPRHGSCPRAASTLRACPPTSPSLRSSPSAAAGWPPPPIWSAASTARSAG